MSCSRPATPARSTARASAAPGRSAPPTRPWPTPAARWSIGTPGPGRHKVQGVLVLALDTATPASTAALVEVTDDGLRGVAERRTVDPRAHGELLAPQISATLAEAGVRLRDVGAIVAGLGPGPFTGLRVGLVTAASIGQ